MKDIFEALLQHLQGGQPAVLLTVAAAGGGKAEITPEGASFLQAYREYNQQIQQFAEQTFERYFAVKQLPPQAKDGE